MSDQIDHHAIIELLDVLEELPGRDLPIPSLRMNGVQMGDTIRLWYWRDLDGRVTGPHSMEEHLEKLKAVGINDQGMQSIDYRRIDRTEFLDGAIAVSTVFLGLDHGFASEHAFLYETIIFGYQGDCIEARYCTERAARRGHAEAVAEVERLLALREFIAQEPPPVESEGGSLD